VIRQLTDGTPAESGAARRGGISVPLRIMVVDDEPEVAKAIKAMTEPLGCDVVILTDSREAAKCLANEKFDGVFVDGRMPNLDGFELTEKVRASALNARVPVVMLTGYDDVQTMRKGFRAGINFFLGKPFTPDRILRLFRAMQGSILREKRRYARLPFRATVVWRSGARSGKAITVNLSEGGILMEIPDRLGLGDSVELEFDLPSTPQKLKVAATVVHTESHGPAGTSRRVAVKFTRVDAVDNEAIQRYILGALPI
jgi:CheY-like chemotaxis protein/Tfp pilus assembly protein PilZ